MQRSGCLTPTPGKAYPVRVRALPTTNKAKRKSGSRSSRDGGGRGRDQGGEGLGRKRASSSSAAPSTPEPASSSYLMRFVAKPQLLEASGPACIVTQRGINADVEQQTVHAVYQHAEKATEQVWLEGTMKKAGEEDMVLVFDGESFELLPLAAHLTSMRQLRPRDVAARKKLKVDLSDLASPSTLARPVIGGHSGRGNSKPGSGLVVQDTSRSAKQQPTMSPSSSSSSSSDDDE